MKRKQIFIFSALFAFILFGFTPGKKENRKPGAQDELIERKIDSLLSIMTLEEKAGQLTQSAGSFTVESGKCSVSAEQRRLVKEGKIGSFLNVFGAELTREIQELAMNHSRLKIPLIFGFDVIHGYKTTFPVPLAEACSWDPKAVEKSARIQAIEASAAGIHWTFAPMVDIARDPRWGRIVEGSGEDPFLGAAMAAARIKGFQGEDLKSSSSLLACAKHFAAYGAAEGGRDYNTVDISERNLREIYLPPFHAAVRAGVGSFMCSFNEIAGIPSSANKYLLTDILRNEWKFDGFVVSDWNSIGELTNHGIATTQKIAGELAIDAGVDMDMESSTYPKFLPELVKEKKVSEEVLNESVRRILRLKFRLGLFDNPFKNCNAELEKSAILTKENIQAALDVARKSIVLLKNNNKLLPLNKEIKTLAVIGPLAQSSQDPLGSWEQLGNKNDVVTALEGIKNKVSSNTKILYAEGCPIKEASDKGFAEAIKAAKMSDAIVMFLGEEGHMSGEARSRSSLELPGLQEELLKEVHKTGKPVVLVLMNGRPLSITWASENIPSIVEAWFLGIQSGNAIADVLFGDYNPSGKLVVSVPRSIGQVPVHYNYKNTGRPSAEGNPYSTGYIDLAYRPLYPFGFGLSYTTFQYGKISLSSNKIKSSESLKVSVDVTNSGDMDGEEVVQLYIRDEFGSVTRPVKELKGFKKLMIKKGETLNVEFSLTKEDLAFYNREMKLTTEPGTFKVFVGPSSADLKEDSFELVED